MGNALKNPLSSELAVCRGCAAGGNGGRSDARPVTLSEARSATFKRRPATKTVSKPSDSFSLPQTAQLDVRTGNFFMAKGVGRDYDKEISAS